MKKFIIRATGAFALLLAVRGSMSLIAPLINNLLTEMGYGFETQAILAGLVLFVGYAGAVFGSLIGSFIADKLGCNRALILCAILYSFTYISWAIASSGIFLLFLRAVLGILSATLTVAVQTYLLGGARKGSEGVAMGIYGLSYGIGTALGSTLAASAEKITASKAFLYIGIFSVIATIIALICTTVDKKIPYQEGFVPAIKDRQIGVSLKSLFSLADKSVYMLLCNAFLYGFSMIIFLQYIDELGAFRGLGETKAAYGIAVYSIASMLQPLSGKIADKIGKLKCVFIGQCLISLGWSAIGLSSNLSIFLVIVYSLISGIGASLYMPCTLSAAQLLVEENAGSVLRGVHQAITSIGSAIAALFGSVIYMKVGIVNVFWLLTVSCILGVVSSFVLYKGEKKTPQYKL